MEAAKIFISHSHKDELIVLEVQRILGERGIKIWAYECNLPFGDKILDEIEKHIVECDQVLVILSDYSRKSQWVGRELGLALKMQEVRGGPRPLIIGLQCDSPYESSNFDILDFRTGYPTGRTYDFSQLRCFNLSSQDQIDSVDYLADTLLPKVTFISETDGEERKLLLDSFKCYEDLFRDEAERDDPADIEVWLDEARHAAVNNDPWREIYAVLHIGEQVIGMAYLSAHLHRSWSFGNYFGVTRTWRGKHRAEGFIEEVSRQLQVVSPTMKGILFEVEPVNLNLLMEVADRSRVGGHPDQEEVISNLRSLKRLKLYQSYRALAILGHDGLPLSYWQPAMDRPLGPENERILILMMRLLEGVQLEDVRLKDILSFIYDDLYGDAYGGAGSVEVRDYRSYVAQVKARVEDGAKGGWSVGPLELPKKIRGLLIRAEREEDLSERLQL